MMGSYRDTGKAAARAKVLVPGIMGPTTASVCQQLRDDGYDPVPLGAIGNEDIDFGLAHVDNDVCIAAIAVIGQYLRYFKSSADERASVLVPQMCKDCRSLSWPQLFQTAFTRAGFTGIEIVEFTSADVAACCPAPDPSAVDAKTIGVCGSVPVLATGLFSRTVVEHLHSSGCKTVTPPLGQLMHSQDFLTPAVEYFVSIGVHTAICIVPFGCMSGHVFARGQVRKLQRHFPEFQLTVLDYDPSASDINVVNRTELVVQSALERAERSAQAPAAQP